MTIRLNDLNHDEEFFAFESERNELRHHTQQSKKREQLKRRKGVKSET